MTTAQPVTISKRNTGWVVYVGGWRVATLKTQKGAERRAERERERAPAMGPHHPRS